MKNIRWFSIGLLLFGPIGGLLAHMQPIKKDGRYYYSDNDTYEHLSIQQAGRLLGKKMTSASRWHASMKSLFNPSAKADRIQKILNPTQTIPQKSSIEPEITWIGHASFLIQCNGFNILTDPIFGNVKAGKLTVSKRDMAPGVQLKDLPHIDAIVISHNHSDHTDTQSLLALREKYDPVVYVPEGNKELFAELGFSKIVETTWWEKHELSKDTKTVIFTCLPAYHWSARFWPDTFSRFGYRASLCASWMISTHNKNIYFAGDTAFGPHFKEIAADFSSINVALMPIGPTSDKRTKHNMLSHIDAKEAIDAFIDLNAHCFIPMHYGTFVSGEEKLELPVAVLHTHWKENQDTLTNKTLLFARCGQSYHIA